jgi:hypothetical protein
MGVVDDLGDQLALATLKAQQELGDDRFYMEVSRVVGAASPTLQEAFMTSMRIRMAAGRAQSFVEQTLKARREGGVAPAAPRDNSAH